MTKNQLIEMDTVAQPLIDWWAKNCGPLDIIVVGSQVVALYEAAAAKNTDQEDIKLCKGWKQDKTAT